jgi:hypothetical protein
MVERRTWKKKEAALNSEMLCNSNLFLSAARYSGELHIFLLFANGERLLASKFLAVNL